MEIGNYRLSSIETGWFALDGGAMFGVVPKTLWQRQIPADDRNRIGLAVRALLLEEIEGSRRILVDTGVGQKWDAKMADIYGVDHGTLRLESSLAGRGLGTGDITDVLLTHLHFDHAGGATRRRERDGEIVPTFENARYWVQARNLAWARNPTEKDRQSYLAENFEPLCRQGVLDTLDGPGEWLPGIELILSEGHTTAMQLPHVHGPAPGGNGNDDGGRNGGAAERHLIYCADLIPTAAHVPVPWVMAYDNAPLIVMAEKRALLPRVVAGDWVVFFEHDPAGPAARIAETERGFAVRERVDL